MRTCLRSRTDEKRTISDSENPGARGSQMFLLRDPLPFSSYPAHKKTMRSSGQRVPRRPEFEFCVILGSHDSLWARASSSKGPKRTEVLPSCNSWGLKLQGLAEPSLQHHLPFCPPRSGPHAQGSVSRVSAALSAPEPGSLPPTFWVEWRVLRACV